MLDFGREPVRVGRSASAELSFPDPQDNLVSKYHAQITFERGAYFLVDTGSTNGTLLNGHKLVGKHELHSGDRICFGLAGGPEVDVQILAPEISSVLSGGAVPHTLIGIAKPSVSRDSTVQAAEQAAREVAEHRAQAGGQHSGQTVIILSRAMNRATETVKTHTRRQWAKALAVVGGVALVVIGVLGGVVFFQQREIDRLVNAKATIDSQIQALQERMQAETDAARLAAMEANLVTLTGSAQNTLQELQRRDDTRAAQLAAGGDALDREIRQILAKFNASTYAIPPIFRERLQFHIDELKRVGGQRLITERKQRYWPTILKEFSALGLPEEMAYIAWVESGFDPNAQSPVGALGLWQMMAPTAQSLGLTVNDSLDERLNPDKQTKAAATHLARLLSEFGEDSFMLVLASYNRGENGVRRALRQVAQEPGGFRKDKRDFWHLYRLKLLPEETREYVPKVLAAAIVARGTLR
jgi:soluble lytic murein transglycosylase-like protein